MDSQDTEFDKFQKIITATSACLGIILFALTFFGGKKIRAKIPIIKKAFQEDLPKFLQKFEMMKAELDSLKQGVVKQDQNLQQWIYNKDQRKIIKMEKQLKDLELGNIQQSNLLKRRSKHIVDKDSIELEIQSQNSQYEEIKKIRDEIHTLKTENDEAVDQIKQS